jgi:hypothetical protein
VQLQRQTLLLACYGAFFVSKSTYKSFSSCHSDYDHAAVWRCPVSLTAAHKHHQILLTHTTASTPTAAATANTAATAAAAAAAVCHQGAVFFDWTKDAIDASAGAPVQLQMQPDLLAAALEAKGVSRDKPVVVSH